MTNEISLRRNGADKAAWAALTLSVLTLALFFADRLLDPAARKPNILTELVAVNSGTGGHATLATKGLNDPLLTMTDQTGSGGVDLGVSSGFGPYLAFKTTTGQEVFRLDTQTKGQRPRLILRDPASGKIVWSIEVNEKGEAIETIVRPAEEPATP